MNWLAIETSTAHGSVALVGGGGVIFEEGFVSKRGHNAAIFGPMERLLGKMEGELGGIVVGTGPGSYGGVRVGIAVGTGLSLAKEAPVMGVSSLLGAPAEAGEDYAVVGDARRGRYFVMRVVGRRVAGEAELLEEAVFVERVGEMLGAGRTVMTFDDRVLPGGGGDVRRKVPSAAVLGGVVTRMGDAERTALLGERLQPIYLREPYVTEPKRQGDGDSGGGASGREFQ